MTRRATAGWFLTLPSPAMAQVCRRSVPRTSRNKLIRISANLHQRLQCDPKHGHERAKHDAISQGAGGHEGRGNSETNRNHKK